MSEFNGFPAVMRYTQVPNPVFSAVFPLIEDITELKVLLHIFEILYAKKGQYRFVSFNDMLRQANLLSSLKVSHSETLRKVLETLTQKGVLLHLAVSQGGCTHDYYFINTGVNQSVVQKARNGELILPGLEEGHPAPLEPHESPDIFTLYEQNIGMLTPLIADELREAEKQYPAAWIGDAIREAVSLNKRNWRYINRILEHWLSEGKDDGTHRGHLKENTDPDKYIRGKYGHMVQR
jgi:DNA replication protein